MIVLDSVRRLLTAGKAPETRADIRPPDLSHQHWVTGWPAVAHRYQGGGSSACTKATIFDRGHLASTDELRRVGPGLVAWCPEPACFPGGRCRVCGVPSGQGRECADCLRDAISVDKAIERAA